MAGYTMMVIPPTLYTFDSLAVSTSQTIVVAQRVPVGVFTEVTLEQRLHSVTTPPAAATIELRVVADGYDSDDPMTTFGQPGTGSVATTSITNTVGVAGDYNVLDLALANGQFVKILLIATRGANAGAFGAKMSIDLQCKLGADSRLQIPPRTYLGYGGFV